MAIPPATLVDLSADVADTAAVALPAVKLAAVPEKFVAVNVGLAEELTSWSSVRLAPWTVNV